MAQKKRVQTAYLALKRCHIYAPTHGFVARREVQVGEFVFPNRTLMSVVPLNQMWVEANFRETQLKDLRIGQPTKVTIDALGDAVIFEGTLQGIQMGSGSAFSLLPAQNATGNWIKIVQRVPVRIELKEEDLLNHPLRIGLSSYVTVDTTDQKGSTVQPPLPSRVVQETEVLSVDFSKIETLMEQIITQNVQYPDP